jgi:hypothetical protein
MFKTLLFHIFLFLYKRGGEEEGWNRQSVHSVDAAETGSSCYNLKPEILEIKKEN